MPKHKINLPVGAFKWRTTSNFNHLAVGDVVRDQRRQGAMFKIVYIHVYIHQESGEEAADLYVVRYEQK